MAGVARMRLTEERKAWRKDKPFGFFARPETAADGSANLMRWKCSIPGREGTDWQGGFFPLTMEFSEDYPAKPPKVCLLPGCLMCLALPHARGSASAQCKFPEKFFHPNVYPSGTVCLSILNEEEGWRPSITVKNILTGIQELLGDPNPLSPAQADAFALFQQYMSEYRRRVRSQAAQYPPPV